MAAMSSMDLADLQSKVTLLEAELEEQTRNTTQAAMFGKSLLEENGDLRNRIDELMKQQAAALEEKEQEICTLRSRTEISACTEKWQQEEITNLRTDLQNARQTILQEVEEDKKREIAAYKKQVTSLQQDMDHLQSMEREQRGRVAELETLLQTHLDRTTHQSFSGSFTSSEEVAALSEELSNLKMDLTEMSAKNIELSGQLQQSQVERETLGSRMKSANLEIEELQCEIVSYSKHIEENRRELLELRAQLDASRMENQGHSAKGNSIFAELEDRRLVLEKLLASLKLQNQQLREKYTIEKQQNNKYKMQVAMALQMSSRREDPAVHKLRSHLSDAHAQIRSLIDQVETLQANQGGFLGQRNMGELLDRVTDQNYAQYLITVIETEREKVAKGKTELQIKSLQHLDVTNQNMELEREKRELESERDKLNSHLIKLTIEKEELLLKYEPDKLKGGTLERRVVEKIDMGEAQSQMQDKVFGTSGRPSDVFKPMATTGRPSDVFKPMATSTGRPSDVFKPMATTSGRPSDVLKPMATTSGRPSDVFKPMATTGRQSDMIKPSAPSGNHSNVFKPMNKLEKSKAIPEEDEPVKADGKSRSISHKVPSFNETDDSVFSHNDKENDDTIMFSESALDVFPNRKVSMADDVKVIYADGEESMTTLANDAEKKAPSESVKRKKKPKGPVRNVQHVSVDDTAQIDCKTQ